MNKILSLIIFVLFIFHSNLFSVLAILEYEDNCCDHIYLNIKGLKEVYQIKDLVQKKTGINIANQTFMHKEREISSHTPIPKLKEGWFKIEVNLKKNQEKYNETQDLNNKIQKLERALEKQKEDFQNFKLVELEILKQKMIIIETQAKLAFDFAANEMEAQK